MRIITRASGAQWFTVAWSFWYWAKFTLNWACFGKARWWCLHTASAEVVESHFINESFQTTFNCRQRHIQTEYKREAEGEVSDWNHLTSSSWVHRPPSRMPPRNQLFYQSVAQASLMMWLTKHRKDTRTLLKPEIRRVIGFYCFFSFCSSRKMARIGNKVISHR